MTTPDEQALEKAVRDNQDSYDHHFATRLWERHGIAASPEVVEAIKGKCRAKVYQGSHSGKRLYKFYFQSKQMTVWMTQKRELYTVT